MASVYLNSGQGPHSEDCTYRCSGNGDGEFSGSPFSPFSPSSPPPAPQPCRHSQLDLVNVGYQRTGYDSSDRYSISMRGNEPVQVHLELGTPPAARNTRGYYHSYNPPATKSLLSSSTLVLASIIVTLVSVHFVKTFNAQFLVRGLIQMLQTFEEKPRKTFRNIWVGAYCLYLRRSSLSIALSRLKHHHRRVPVELRLRQLPFPGYLVFYVFIQGS